MRRRIAGAAMTAALIGWAALGAAPAVHAQAAGAAPAARAQAKKPAAKPAAAASAAAATPAAAAYAQQFAGVCAACHGANGRSDMAGVPVLAGQHSLYAITQLFLFREGRRHNEAMIAIAKPMKDADMRGYADYIGTLPPVAPPAPAAPPDAAKMSKGLALAQQHKCVYCHGADLSGADQIPRIGGQKEDYLRAALHGFKSGERPGYTRAMTEALSQVPVEDLDPLAYFVANMPVK